MPETKPPSIKSDAAIAPFFDLPYSRSILKNESLANKLLNEHCIAGYLYSHRQDLDLPILQQSYLQQRQYNLILSHALKALTNEFFSQGLRPCLLKGIILKDMVYKNHADRQMSDIDLFIRPQEVVMAAACMKKLGFKKINQSTWAANKFKYEYEKSFFDSDVVVEIHTRLIYGDQKITWQMTPISGMGCTRLANSDFLAHLILHVSAQHTFLKLNWLLDIDLFMRTYECDWRRIEDICKQVGAKNALIATLFVLTKYFNTPAPRYLIDDLARFSSTFLGRLLTEEFLWQPKLNAMNYFLIKHLLKDRLANSIKYDVLWAINRLNPRNI